MEVSVFPCHFLLALGLIFSSFVGTRNLSTSMRCETRFYFTLGNGLEVSISLVVLRNKFLLVYSTSFFPLTIGGLTVLECLLRTFQRLPIVGWYSVEIFAVSPAY